MKHSGEHTDIEGSERVQHLAEADPLGASLECWYAVRWGSLRAGDSAGQLSSALDG